MKGLFVDACIRGEASRTLGLARSFLDELARALPELELETVELNRVRPRPLFEDTLARREEAAQRGFDGPEFALARQFREAELLVLAAPFWEGTFPAAFHAYWEQVCVAGLTFLLDETGYRGLCRGKRAVFITTRGGIYETGPAVADNHAPGFLRTVLTMLGIPRLDVVAAEGLDMVGVDAAGALGAAREKLTALAAAWGQENRG